MLEKALPVSRNAGGRSRWTSQPDRRAWWNKLISVLVALVVVGIVPFFLGGDETRVTIGRLLAVIALVVVLRWGYWRNRR